MIVDLYNSIYLTLSQDDGVLNLLGLNANSSALDKAKKIQKRARPSDLAISNMPLITFFAPPGRRDAGNMTVYNVGIIFDIYTNDDVNKAQRLADRIYDLFNQETPELLNLENFECYVVSEHESATDLENVYCFTVVVEFSIVIDTKNN